MKPNHLMRAGMQFAQEIANENHSYHRALYRVASAVIAFIFLNFYSKAIFVVFMGREGFFSYDLFASGGLGMEVFFVATEVIIVFMAIAFFGIIIPIYDWKYNGRKDWGVLAGCALLNVVSCTFLLLGAISAERGSWVGLVLLGGIASLVAWHIANLLHRPAKVTLASQIVLLLFLTAATVALPGEVSSWLKQGLRVFGVGGEIPVSLVADNDTMDRTTGRLVLLSPEHAYVIVDGERELSIVPRESVRRIQVGSQPNSSNTEVESSATRSSREKGSL